MAVPSPSVVLHSPLLLTLLVPIVSAIIFFFFTRKAPPLCTDGRRLPPSPWGLPVLGHLPLLGSLPHRKLRSLARAHGPVMLLRLGRVPTVVASSAAAAHEAMKTRDLAFASRPKVRMAERLLYGRDVVFAPYGEYWRQARRICVLHLLSPRRVHSFGRVREQEVAVLLDRVRSPAGGSSPYPGAVNLSDMLVSYASSVIKRVAFGDGAYSIGCDEGGDRLRKVFAELEEALGTPTVGEFMPWLGWVDRLTGLDAMATRTYEALDGLLERVIADHRQRRRLGGGRPVGEDDHRDFVDVLLDVSESEEAAGGVRFDTVDVKAIILDMFGAGTDTTYTTLEWAMAELINHPREMRKLHGEIRAVAAAAADGAGAGCHVSEGQLDQLPYLRAVVKETLRLHAPVPLLVPRETLEDTELLGYRVPARTRVLINAWAIGRDPATWERAEEFVPERFVVTDDGGGGGGGGGPAEYMLGRDFSFIPFGAGRRGCPGVGFAVPSIELALANMLCHFDWELPAAAGTSAVDMSELNGLSVRLKATLHLVATPWSP